MIRAQITNTLLCWQLFFQVYSMPLFLWFLLSIALLYLYFLKKYLEILLDSYGRLDIYEARIL